MGHTWKNRPRKIKLKRKKSTWGAAVVSFLKEFFLNSGDIGVHWEYEENLADEGSRKKKLIWAVIFVLQGIFFASTIIWRWDVYAEHPFAGADTEALGIGMIVWGVMEWRKNRRRH